MMIKNCDIRDAASKNGVKLWQIATQLNISDGNFSRKLRKEFSEAEKERIFEIINRLAQEGT